MGRGVAGVSVGVRGSGRRGAASDWGAGGLEKGPVDEAVCELGLER